MHEYLEIEVELTEIEPRIWRRFLLPSDGTLRNLHDAIEDAFDWGNWGTGCFYTDGDESGPVAGDYDRMQTLRMFARDHADEYRGRRVERYECLRRVAEVIGDEL